jgi:hypothetical protein
MGAGRRRRTDNDLEFGAAGGHFAERDGRAEVAGELGGAGLELPEGVTDGVRADFGGLFAAALRGGLGRGGLGEGFDGECREGSEGKSVAHGGRMFERC